MRLWEKDGNRDHMVQPALIYISEPDEYGLIYTKAELEALRSVADARHLKICCDGARLAYALAAPENDDTLEDPAHLTDAFFIGGTKCGALFGEALVFPKPELVPPLLHVREAARSPPCQGTSARRPIRGLLRGWAL
jgi:threonine aldolase